MVNYLDHAKRTPLIYALQVGGDYSPIVVPYFAAVGNAHCGTFPKMQGGYCPLSIVVLIHGGKGPRKVGQVPS